MPWGREVNVEAFGLISFCKSLVNVIGELFRATESGFDNGGNGLREASGCRPGDKSKPAT
jgi:hypothetical protein